uniref:(northern house mosquito) hypothetical protein n=1 Tax=Culex pipiens TaxID=7175 RepID=A0A8D8AUI0_CULPI
MRRRRRIEVPPSPCVGEDVCTFQLDAFHRLSQLLAGGLKVSAVVGKDFQRCTSPADESSDRHHTGRATQAVGNFHMDCSSHQARKQANPSLFGPSSNRHNNWAKIVNTYVTERTQLRCETLHR